MPGTAKPHIVVRIPRVPIQVHRERSRVRAIVPIPAAKQHAGTRAAPPLSPKPEDARRFIVETGVNMLAPAIGNIHGMLKHMPNPHLDIGRIKDIRKSANVPLVLHGGSGISEEDFTAAIDAGISLIHISTELRVAWKKGIEDSLKEKPDEIAPYKILEKSVTNLEKVIEKRMKLFLRTH